MCRWTAARLRPRYRPPLNYHKQQTRSLFNIFKKKPEVNDEPTPLLTQDNLFHHFSKSPFPAVRERGKTVQKLAPCPVCASASDNTHADAKVLPKSVKFECPDCGWPTHCSEEHWKGDEEHRKYCSRLREVNEDDHDLRSGRRMREFELPGPHDSEGALSFANWDLFWYTRGFPSMDTERSRRHASKILTYPITIGSILHQYSGLTMSNQRVTPEGSRSLAALRSTLHVPLGTPETQEAGVAKPQVRVFILGARAEAALPVKVWEQFTMLFPSATVRLFFIGRQVPLARPVSETKKPPEPTGSTPKASSSTAETPAPTAENTTSQPSSTTSEADLKPKDPQPTYLPNFYEPPTPAPIERHKRTREDIERFGVPSYSVPYTYHLTVTGMQANYMEVHHVFQDTFDPYTDLFVLFSPGLGFPSPTSRSETGEKLLQIVSPTEWGPVIPALLETKCPIFVTGFSPVDVERDIRSLATAPGVAGEFDWIITPGPNPFGSEKWEVADFDPRVMVKTNWGIWGIRGKSREIRERNSFLGLRF